MASKSKTTKPKGTVLDKVKLIGGIVKDICLDDEVSKFLVGTYTDGSTRSVVDAIGNEYISPKTKRKALEYNKVNKLDLNGKKKHKKKKHHKKKDKHKNADIQLFRF